MGILVWDTAPSKIFVWWSEVASVWAGDTKVRPVTPPYLCFTANSYSTIKLVRYGSAWSVTLETSRDLNTWTTYTLNQTISLNAGDKIYRRNTSETGMWFSRSDSYYYQFFMTWSIAASWDIWYLINKNSTSWLHVSYPRTFYNLFNSCSSLTSCPEIKFTSINASCFQNMFVYCTGLTTLPKLYATAIYSDSYKLMFYGCSKIKLSTAQTWEYQTPYRIPVSWTWSWIGASDMFTSTWWTRAWTPTINTTYYTSNTVV